MPLVRAMHFVRVFPSLDRKAKTEWIFSEIYDPLDFNETLVNGSVFNIVSINNIRFLRKSLFIKLSSFKIIYIVCNSEENEILIFIAIACFKKNLSKKTDIPNLMDTTFSFYCVIEKH